MIDRSLSCGQDDEVTTAPATMQWGHPQTRSVEGDAAMLRTSAI